MRSKTVKLRQAVLADADMVYVWRNHPETYRFFFQAEPIGRDTHVKWFTAAIANPCRHLLIAEYGSTAIGVLRFDYDNTAHKVEIDIYTDPEKRGQGYGQAIILASIEWVKQHFPS